MTTTVPTTTPPGYPSRRIIRRTGYKGVFRAELPCEGIADGSETAGKAYLQEVPLGGEGGTDRWVVLLTPVYRPNLPVVGMDVPLAVRVGGDVPVPGSQWG